ncbi:MAG: T9SS type A sorting domain-containing protein [Ignavibacteriaceae bacterium]
MKKVLSMFFWIILFGSGVIVPQSNGINSQNGVQVTFPFLDDVEDTSASSSYWQRDATVWKMQQATAHSGTNIWAMLPTTGSYVYLTLATPINLSSAPNPYLSFWIRKSDGGTGALSIEASSNGGANWTVISQPSFSGNLYVRFQVPLSNFLQSNALVRIGCYAPYGNTYYVDDILIDNAPTPKPIILSSPGDNGMNVHWNQSTATDFYKYRIILSTDASSVNNFYVTPSLSYRTETKVLDFFTQTQLDTLLTDLTFANTLYYAKVYEEDTQNLVNQGSDRSDLSTSFNITSQTTPFVQDFEGSFNWVADLPWAVTTDDAGDPNHSPTHAYEDSPQGNYDESADRRLTAQVNLSGVQRPALKFNHKYSFETSSDYGVLEISIDNVTWTALNGFTGNTGGEWESRTYDVGVLKQQSTGYIRFKTLTSGSNQQDGWHLDDVEIFNNTKTQSFPLFDDVEVDTFSQNHWIAGSFDLKLANAHSGAQVWSLKPSGGSYNYLTLAGKLNLSSAPNPYLSFWVKKADGGTGALSIEASNDGGLTWTVLSQPSFNGAQYVWFESSLSNFRQANVLVRIGCYAPYGGSYYVDDILIDNAPTPRALTLLTPTNNGMKVRWGISTAADFGNYRVVLSTDQNQVNNYFNVTALSNHSETRVFDIFNQAVIETTLTDLTFMNTMYYAKIYEKDTQLFINQGSDRADLSTSFNVVSQTAPFIQDFENTFGWASDLPWAVTTDDASEPGHSATHAMEDSPGTNYSENSDRRLVVQVNTLGVPRPVLRFNHKHSFETGSDYGVLEYSVDNVTWTTITGITGNTNTLWESSEFDITPIKQLNAAYLRFKTISNGSTQSDGWHLDDVEIYNNTKTLGIPLFDDAEVDTVSENFWIAGVYKISPANSHSGTQVWALPPSGGSYNYLTLSGVMNLSNAPNPFLSFWIKKADGGTGALSIEASNNGGLTWTALAQPSFNGANYINYNYSLLNYRQNNVLIRIGCYSPYGNTYLLDDITIADSTGWTGVDDLNGVTPTEFELSQNYPNPFNPSTTIRYAIPNESKVSVSVFNLLGQEVATLVNDIQSAGYHEVIFNASQLSSGVYLYRINAISSTNSKEFTSTKKFILLK